MKQQTQRFVVELNKKYLDQILLIEQQVHINPWSRQMFSDCLNNKLYKILGLIDKDVLIGYGVLQIKLPDADLLNLAVSQAQQNRGMGAYLLGSLIQYCVSHQITTLMLEVRASNQGAIHLYEKNGFEQVGVRENYYAAQNSNERDDALLYNFEISAI